MSSHEYTKPTAGGQACTYATLCDYNDNHTMAPVPKNGPIVGKMIIPQYAAIGYDALTHGGSCAGYPNINSAYGSNGSCNQKYITSLCGGCNKK